TTTLPPPRPTLYPYTTLFRSRIGARAASRRACQGKRDSIRTDSRIGKETRRPNREGVERSATKFAARGSHGRRYRRSCLELDAHSGLPIAGRRETEIAEDGRALDAPGRRSTGRHRGRF